MARKYTESQRSSGTLAKSIVFANGIADRGGSAGSVANLTGGTATGDGSGRTDFWAFLAGPGPVYDFLEVAGDPLTSWPGSRIGTAVEPNGKEGLAGKIARIYRASDGDHTIGFNRVRPPDTCTSCVILVDYDTGNPIAGEPVTLGGINGTTDSEGKFCVSLPRVDGSTVGGGSGEYTNSVAQHSDYNFEPFCFPCGETRTVTMFRRDKWVDVQACCFFDVCQWYRDGGAGRRPGILPRKLYGVISGFEPATGTGVPHELEFAGFLGAMANIPTWRSALFESGAYGSCPGCKGECRPIPDPNPFHPRRRICDGWCRHERRAGHGCNDDYDLSGVPNLINYPIRTQRDKKVYYPSSRIVFEINAFNYFPDAVPCTARLTIQHYWDAEGTRLAGVTYSGFSPPACDTCEPQVPIGPQPVGQPFWPICDTAVCECGKDEELTDFYDPALLPTDKAVTQSDISNATFCGPVDLVLHGSGSVVGCDPYGDPTVFNYLATVVE